MLTAQKVKTFVKEHGGDIVGISPIERFNGAPEQMNPKNIFPEAKSVIVTGCRIPRGVYRGIEEGTHWNNYTFYGYNKLNTLFRPLVTYETSCFIEDNGWEAVPVYPGVSEAQPKRSAVAKNRTPSDVIPAIRIAAVAAGLGEISYSKVFVSPVLGPRVRLGMILTDAKLDPDPLFDGKICTHCMKCVKECPGGAIPHIKENKLVKIKIEDKEISWADVDMGKCTLSHHGLNKKCSPFLAKDFPGINFDVEKQNLSEEAAYKMAYTLGDNGWRKSKEFPSGMVMDYYSMILNHTGYFAICGARGCIRACMDNLEKSGRIEAKFNNPFYKRNSWLLDDQSK